jgi:hypothetical protein
MARAPKKAKAKAKKASPVLSGNQIESELTLAHKMLAVAGSTISLMLSSRRLSMTRLTEAADRVHGCSAHMTRLVEMLKR